MERTYQVILAVGAREEIREMDETEKDFLAAALRTELLDDDGTPVADAWIHLRKNASHRYAVHQLTSGHVVVFRLATHDELERTDAPDDGGVVVFDILSGGEAIPGGVVLPAD